MRLWDDVIERWRPTQLIAAIGAAIVPGEENLIAC